MRDVYYNLAGLSPAFLNIQVMLHVYISLSSWLYLFIYDNKKLKIADESGKA